MFSIDTQGATTRITFPHEFSTRKRVVFALLGLAVLTWLGPSALAELVLREHFECTRGDARVDCVLTQTSILGRRREVLRAQGVTGVALQEIADDDADGDGQPWYQLHLETPLGRALALSGSEASTQSMQASLRAFLDDPGRTRVTLENLFNGGELVCAILAASVWLALLIWLLRLPRRLRRPQLLEVDGATRALRVRARSGRRLEAVPFAELRAVRLWRDGLGLLFHSDRRLDLANEADLTFTELEELGTELSARLGVPLEQPPAPP